MNDGEAGDDNKQSFLIGICLKQYIIHIYIFQLYIITLPRLSDVRKNPFLGNQSTLSYKLYENMTDNISKVSNE